MKVISSLGGPYIVLDRRYIDTWSGVFGKRFIGLGSPLNNDYEAACDATGGLTTPPTSISEITSVDCTAFLIASPAEIAVFGRSNGDVLIVQVEAADADWSYNELTESVLGRIVFKEKISTNSVRAADYIVFDSSREFSDVGDEFLSFSLGAGKCSLSEAYYNQGTRAELTLFLLGCDSSQPP